MFKSATIFRIATDFTLPPLAMLEEALQAAKFLHCGPTQPESCGWVAPRGNKSTVLVEAVGGGVILRLQTERRQLPASAVKDETDRMIEQYKQTIGIDRVGAKLKKEFREEAIQTLLPRAFTKRSAVALWLDPVNHWLVVDSASLTGADKAVSQLIEALAECGNFGSTGILAKPLQTTTAAGAAMAHWLAMPRSKSRAAAEIRVAFVPEGFIWGVSVDMETEGTGGFPNDRCVKHGHAVPSRSEAIKQACDRIERFCSKTKSKASTAILSWAGAIKEIA